MDMTHLPIDIGKEKKILYELRTKRKQMHTQSKVSQLQWATSVTGIVGGC